MILKAYKFRLYPNEPQRVLFNKHLGSARFIYNWALELKIKNYKQKDKKITFYDLNNKLPNLKKEFIKEVAQIIGTFDKALNSPRMLASSVVSQGRSQIQSLIIDYPEHSDSATVRTLKRLLDKAEFVTSLGSSYYNTRIEVNGVIAVRELIDKIESGLGVAL